MENMVVAGLFVLQGLVLTSQFGVLWKLAKMEQRLHNHLEP